MIRQNKDGRPIYSDKIWYQIVENGKKLQNLGYEESIIKPNLFYKILTSNQGKNGLIFVDLRDTDVIPIWDEPNPITYKNDHLAFNDFIKEVVKINGLGVRLRFSFYNKYEPDGWGFFLMEIPSGYCKRCGKDILNEVDWAILQDGVYNAKIQENLIDINIEVNHCNICKKMEYAKQEYREKCLKIADLCELCGKKNAELTHHITYDPPKTIRLCRSCHSVLHKKDFPNPIWKEKRISQKKNHEKTNQAD
ncbi:MAG: hypothetical protein ACFFAN_09880 [Promethearchaeota archaeon]